MQLPLSQILITDRQRLSMDEDHIANLMESFKDIGQVQAVLVALRDINETYQADAKQIETFLDNTKPEDVQFIRADKIIPVEQWPQPYRIVAGATRCVAAQRLGWTHIRADVVDSQHATEAQRQKAEYVENALRRDLPWQDSCLALARLHSIIKNERALEGQSWTHRMLANFTGYKQVQMSYMLKVAEGLRKEPRDEELWNCGGWMPAVQLLLARVDDEATRELQRRKDEEDEDKKLTDWIETDIHYQEDESEGDDKLLILTQESAPVPRYINVPPPSPVSLAIISTDSPEHTKLFLHHIKPGGFIAVFGAHILDWPEWKAIFKPIAIDLMPFPIVWDKTVLLPQTAWPIVPNHTLIMLLQKHDPTQPTKLHPNPATSIITSFPDQNNPQKIPIAVVNHLTKTFCEPGDVVLNPDGKAVDALIELGHPPCYEVEKVNEEELEELT